MAASAGNGHVSRKSLVDMSAIAVEKFDGVASKLGLGSTLAKIEWRNLAALAGLLWTPAALVFLIVGPLLYTGKGNFSDAFEECERHRAAITVGTDNMLNVHLEDMPLSIEGFDLETRGDFGFLYVADSGAARWEKEGLTSDWALYAFALGVRTAVTDFFEQDTLPVDSQGRRGYCPMCSFETLQEMGPRGVRSYMNTTLRKHLPVTALFVRLRPGGGRKPLLTSFASHYCTVLLAMIITSAGVLIATTTQLRGWAKTDMDRRVLLYFLVALLANGPGGAGYISLTSNSPGSRTNAWGLFLMICYFLFSVPCTFWSNIMLQWTMIYKIEAVSLGRSQCRRLRLALRVEHWTLGAMLVDCIFFMMFINNTEKVKISSFAFLVLLIMLFVADIIFSVVAIVVYAEPLRYVRRVLAQHRTNRLDSAEIRALQSAYRVVLLNLIASVLAVISTSTSYAAIAIWVIGLGTGHIPEWNWDWALRLCFFDSVVNDICTIIFADMLFMGDSSQKRTLWAMGQIGVQAALLREEDESQQQQLKENLSTLARGPNLPLREHMGMLEEGLRIASLTVLAEGRSEAADEIFKAMRTVADAEMKRLLELSSTILGFHRRASARFEHLLAIEGWPCAEVRQYVPARLAAPPVGFCCEDNGPTMRYLYRKADIIAPEFKRSMTRLIETFNVAIEPADLGLDPERFPFQVFPSPDSRAILTWGPKKTEARCWQKLRSDEDYALRKFPQAACLLDIERMTVTFPDAYSLSVFYAFLEQEGSLPLARVKNHFVLIKEVAEVFNYPCLLINVEVNGLIVEIQLALRDLDELKRCMHAFYKVVRATDLDELVSQCIFIDPHDETRSANAGAAAAMALHSLPTPWSGGTSCVSSEQARVDCNKPTEEIDSADSSPRLRSGARSRLKENANVSTSLAAVNEFQNVMPGAVQPD